MSEKRSHLGVNCYLLFVIRKGLESDFIILSTVTYKNRSESFQTNNQ
ncbi:hypothetical protein D1AOALGA4SA_7112 [Olavius algarvensis Delta 1 endosymbiont]|nr:hypothetical protein D1AOALGA4SA_7112 [Olavius algarvensis Delta 1 endosymbiont]